MTRAAALLLPLLLLVGCAPAPAPAERAESAVGSGLPGELTGADPALLERWADFPADRAPRPIVLLGQVVQETGYHTGDAKLAVAMGRLALEAPLPAGPATVRVALPGGAVEVPAISAQRAYDILGRLGDPKNAPGADPQPLRITKVALGSAEFPTDRGRLRLPAWLFTAPDSMAPLAVPAPAEEAFWRPGENGYGGFGSVTVAADGVTLTVTLPQPGEPCPGEPARRWTAEAVESATAVTVGLRADVVSAPAAAPSAGDCVRDGMLRTAPYQVTLAKPLGGRVLVGSDGGAVSVETN